MFARQHLRTVDDVASFIEKYEGFGDKGAFSCWVSFGSSVCGVHLPSDMSPKSEQYAETDEFAAKIGVWCLRFDT